MTSKTINLFRENKPSLPKIWCGGKEKGVALLITFLIMGIALSIVLGVSVILVSEIKVIREMGNSVKAFYAADTGIEEIIYFDNKKIPTGGTRGFCNICNVCADFGCQGCISSGSDCGLTTCQNCQVSYCTGTGCTGTGDKKYNVIGSITPTEESFKSYGTYLKTTRAIELNFAAGSDDAMPQAPMIYNASVAPRTVSEGIELEIVADIFDADGVENAEVHIQYPDENDYVVMDFPLYTGITYKATWIGSQGLYYVDITACDTENNCSEKENI